VRIVGAGKAAELRGRERAERERPQAHSEDCQESVDHEVSIRRESKV
jgi:hypothetical protein